MTQLTLNFQIRDFMKGNAGRIIGQKLMQLFTQSGAYYNENGMTVHKWKLQTRGIIIDVPHQS
ncbi:MAG: hypothetical protein Pg6B_10610 [Candidatus Azobacteroides pseudotrichonymphae]|nr:MAG: hypothetical protein Pg6B_10610 [Candidatus Azobacteroides pseudotrichonymphae]